jgi:hypothetical protein
MWTDGHDEAINAFRDFGNAPKNRTKKINPNKNI